MPNLIRKLFSRYIPVEFHRPHALLLRLLRSKDPAALFTMATVLLGIVCTPLDLLLQIREGRRYQNVSSPEFPLIFVVGPPRSGTTLVAQVLIAHLPVCYLNNLTAVFPRSPITANVLLGKFLGPPKIAYRSYYGKSLHLSGPNDALYIWDRWLGKDRTQVPTVLSDRAKEDMIRFFSAYQEACPKPFVNKVNRLVSCAHIVAEVLDKSYFICLKRDPVYLAQSLLRARLDIHGDVTMPYGVTARDLSASRKDYIQDVCDQVTFYEQKIAEQLQAIGPSRFWITSYEDFCKDPAALVKRVSEEILQHSVDPGRLQAELQAFKASNRATVDAAILARIRDTLGNRNIA
jgi:hypothetical protein